VNILITGATGFTGSFVTTRLLERPSTHVRCFVRRDSDLGSIPVHEVELAYGDLNRPETLAQALRGVDVLVNIASLGFGHAPTIVNAAQIAGVKRSVFISTTAIFTTLNASSKSIRLAAEHSIQTSNLEYTILRPTMIYGTSRDRNMVRLIRYIQRWPVIPVFGDGNYLQQPVYVDDLVKAIIAVIDAPKTIRKSYRIPGKEPISYNQLIHTVCKALCRSIKIIHIPASLVVRCLQMTEKLKIRLPIKSEQVLRLNENKIFSYQDALNDFNYQPIEFSEGIRREIQSLEV